MSFSPRHLDGPRLFPAHGGKAKQLVIFLHGYGADGHDLMPLASHCLSLLPDAVFVAPHAPESVPGLPGGRQWFGLERYNPNTLRAGPDEERGQSEAMAAAAIRPVGDLRAFLTQETERLAISFSHVALVGFSQGTMLALAAGLDFYTPLAGIVGFSGAFLRRSDKDDKTEKTDPMKRPPVLLVHGDADAIVPVEAMFSAVNRLAGLGIAVEWHVRPGLGHGIDGEGMKLAISALTRWLKS